MGFDLERQSSLSREDAFGLATDLEGEGVKVNLTAHYHGWRVTPQRNTDLVALAGVCQMKGFHVFYGLYGMENPDVVIFAGSRP